MPSHVLTFSLPFAMSAPPEGGAGALLQFLPMVVIFGALYLLIIMPMQREQRKLEELRSSLKPGDEIVLSGGLIGKVVKVDDPVVTLDIGGGTKVRALKSGIQSKGVEKTNDKQ